MKTYFLFALFLCGGVLSAPPRNLSFDFGLGVPQLLLAEGNILLSSKWQIGFGYGLLPIPFPAMSLPAQEISPTPALKFSFTPQIKFGLATWSPFIRYFPTVRNTYFQFSYSMLRVTADITSDVKLVGTSVAIPNSYINGSLTLVQPMPTLSMGYLLSGNLSFLNLSMGLSLFIRATADITITGRLPDAAGADGTTAALESAKTSISAALTEAVSTVTKQLFMLPSIVITYGFYL